MGAVAASVFGLAAALQANAQPDRCAQPLQSAKTSLRDQPAVTIFRTTNPGLASEFDLAAAEELPICARSHKAPREERKALARSVTPTSAIVSGRNASHTIAIAQAPLSAP
ncbi:MAG: hypothetical protein JO234_11895 [Hyphomicrobiales bacterium]|nr:hypothetical protein [Hyphomicrobiales bacterium]